MDKKIPVLAGMGIVLIGIGIFTASDFQETETIEVEDIVGREIEPSENISEIQEKMDNIEKSNIENEYTPKEREWITSGPFQIDRSEYLLGEKIFLRIGGIEHEEKGQVVFLRPLNSTHYSVYMAIPFDGADKPAFNYYLEPDLSKAKGLCTVDDIVGDWRVVFRGTVHSNLGFKVTEEILPGDEERFKPVC